MIFDENKYELLQQESIEDLNIEGYMFRHKKSGARVVILSNDDDNKVFTIGFRTPPADSTGVMHILEHSVLCGSEKYPLKDPFIELAKGSLNTFLNAMTYPDKTIYPVASCNDVDFNNLIDVYMDAVLHPNIYKREEIFMQEGWHYELDTADSPLKYNGVVYNEMKGAFSSPDDLLGRYCLNSLYPDTSYATESGGDPECIPDLTYENFLETHRKLYHPSNSYIVIYGDCDMTEKLEYLDREYLCNYDAIPVDSELLTQTPFDKMRRVEAEYSVTEDEGAENNAYLAYNVSVGMAGDVELDLAISILDYALFSAPGAPVRQALIDAGLGEDVICDYETDTKQPVYSIASKNCDEKREKEFLEIIMNTLNKIVEEGIDRNALLAAISSSEFRYREADVGNLPKGLLYTTMVLDTWLYDDNKPFVNLPKNKLFKMMRQNVGTDYFENIVKKYFIENTHSSLVILKPVVNLTQIREAKLADKLAQYKASLSKEEIDEIVAKTAHLKEYQAEPATEEELNTIPLLSREDIRKEIIPLSNIEQEVAGTKLLRHDYFTNGIGYIKLCFNTDAVEDEYIPYIGLLVDAFAYVDTKNYKYDKLTNAIDIHTGGISVVYSAYQNCRDNKTYADFEIKCKAITEEYPVAMNLIEEIVFSSKYDEYKRLKEILAEIKSNLHDKFISSGHIFSVAECKKQFNEASKYASLTSGYEYYQFIVDLYENFDEKKEALAGTLKSLIGRIFDRSKLVISFTGDEKLYEDVFPAIEKFVKALPCNNPAAVTRHFELKKSKIAYRTASQVNYVARCGCCGDEYPYDGAIKVLRTMLAYDYLWNNVRVQGGAYGCMNAYTNTGIGSFCSYRDPNLERTIKVYEAIPEYIDSLNVDEREMVKYVIGTFSGLDMPMSPRAKGARSFDMYLQGIDEATLQKHRDQSLNATIEDIKKLKPRIEKILEDDYLVVVGSGNKIDENRELFDEIINL